MVARDVVTISRQVGSGGDEIAGKVARILGYAYFDKTLMMKVAKDLGISCDEIADFSEDSYEVKSLVDKILRRKRPVTSSFVQEGDVQIRKALDEEKCLAVIQDVIKSLALNGKTVIVGRGGQAILKDNAATLHVKVVAPLEIRIQRIMKIGGLSERVAKKTIEDSDRATAEYIKRFYGIDWADQTFYDMVINTWKLDFDTAAKMIVSVVRKMW